MLTSAANWPRTGNRVDELASPVKPKLKTVGPPKKLASEGPTLGESIDTWLKGATRPDATAVRTYLVLHYAATLITKKVDQHLAKWGLSTPRYAILRLLEDKEPVTLSWLTRSHVCAAGNITTLVARLQRDGLVQCTTDPKDRRITRVQLTGKGSKLVKSAVEPHRRFLSELMGAVSTKDLQSLATAVDKIASELINGRDG